MKLIRSRDLKSAPWKNGAGITTEIAIAPPTSSVSELDFDWRISRAEIRGDAPFSQFPGYDRSLTVLGPDSLVLNGAVHNPLAPFSFAGEEVVQASLLGPMGFSVDFGVIFRRGLQCEMRILTLSKEVPHRLTVPVHFKECCLYLCEGVDATVLGQRLSPGDSLLFSLQEVESNFVELTCSVRGVVIAVLVSTSTTL